MPRVATVLAIVLLGSLSTSHTWVAAGPIAAAALLGAIEAFRTRRIPPEAWLLLIPFGYWTLSFLLTRESASVFVSISFLRWDGAIFISLLPIAALAALPLDRHRLTGALLVYLAFHAALAVVGGIGAVTGWHSAFYRPAEMVDDQPTFFGLFKAHNATASVYVLLTLGALALGLRPEASPKARRVLLGLAGVLALGCIIARSRGAFLALGVGVVFVVVQAVRRGVSRRVMIAAIAGVAVAIVAGSGLLLPRFLDMLKKNSDSFRREKYARAWDHFERSPAIGIGFGRYNDQEHAFESIGVGTVAVRAIVANDDYHAHNSYLHWMAEGGLVGLAVMIVFWILIVRRLKGDDGLREWILAAIVALAVLSLTEHYAGGGVFLTHLAFLIGVRQAREGA